MRRAVLVLLMLGLLSVAAAPAFARDPVPAATAPVDSAAISDQAVVTPVWWYGPRYYYPGWYGGAYVYPGYSTYYYGPDYVPGPTYVYPGGVYYYGQRFYRGPRWWW